MKNPFNPFNANVVWDGLDDVIENGTNADIVSCYGADCVEEGMKIGFLISAALVSGFVAGWNLVKLIDKKIKKISEAKKLRKTIILNAETANEFLKEEQHE